MIRLTEEQSKVLNQEPDHIIRVMDPQSSQTYVLMKDTDFEHIKELLQEDKELQAIARDAWQNLSHLLKDEPW